MNNEYQIVTIAEMLFQDNNSFYEIFMNSFFPFFKEKLLKIIDFKEKTYRNILVLRIFVKTF